MAGPPGNGVAEMILQNISFGLTENILLVTQFKKHKYRQKILSNQHRGLPQFILNLNLRDQKDRESVTGFKI